jgi:hypothetical protein
MAPRKNPKQNKPDQKKTNIIIHPILFSTEFGCKRWAPWEPWAQLLTQLVFSTSQELHKGVKAVSQQLADLHETQMQNSKSAAFGSRIKLKNCKAPSLTADKSTAEEHLRAGQGAATETVMECIASCQKTKWTVVKHSTACRQRQRWLGPNG